MGGMTSLSNRECANLLKEWGFEEIGYNGGHLVMQRDGRRVQISAPTRSASTPYKALRRAAKILGVTLQEFLAGPPTPKKKKVPEIAIRPIRPMPVTEEKKEEEMSTAVAEEIEVLEVETAPAWKCDECGKSDFTTLRGFRGHLRAHERVRCNICGGEFSRMGIGPHQTGCTPERKRGRRRNPIAETLEDSSRGRKKDLGIEVPLLENYDEDFPSAEDFAPDPEAHLKTAFDLLLPDVERTAERYDSFKRWVEATRTMFI